ncbi:uncharacterized protein V6R79_000787 [Siganus canaliculatus]
MAASWTICWTQMCLLAFLVFSHLTTGSQLEMMLAPNLLRVGTAENIFVEIQDCTFQGNVRVQINVLDHLTKSQPLASTSVTLTREKHFQDFVPITIPTESFKKDPNIEQYVYLQAHFPGRMLEKVVLVSFQAGHIFIQTDRTLYTPNSNVYFRIFAVTPDMQKPVQDGTHIDIEIERPDGIILPQSPINLRSGIYSGRYSLGDTFSHGLWKVVAKFRNIPQHKFAAEFEVKRYVLPSFEVKVTPLTYFFQTEAEELTVNIEAKYLSGEVVDGTAYAAFGVVLDDIKQRFPQSLQRVEVTNGIGKVTLKREHITENYRSISSLLDRYIYVGVTVLSNSGGEIVDAELRNIRIISSPYTVNFRKSSRYFKPGMPFQIVVEVLNPDDTPAAGVTVVVDPGQISQMTAANGIIHVTHVNTHGSDSLTITAKTSDGGLPSERQASATMTVHPSLSPSNSYILIGVSGAEVKLGQTQRILFSFSRQENSQRDVTYLIVSRGQLVTYGRFQIQSQIMFTLTLPVTKEMMPSFRIVAYYHTNNNEMVSDSVWVDVMDSCMGSLKLEASRPLPYYQPRRMFGLRVTGDPEATVGLVAVDKGVYVLNKLRLSQKKIWDAVEKFDSACTAGGGKDSMSVFYDAGLMFVSHVSGTPPRQETKCPVQSRRKRADATRKVKRSEDDYYVESDEITSRGMYPESWLWFEIKMPPCPRETTYCDSTTYVKNVPLQDSVTTWQVTAVSLSRTHGICVADPLEVTVQKNFHIDLRVPYSAVRGEQLEIKAILHNYTPDDITVRVELLDEMNLCSSAFKRGKYVQYVNVGPETTQSVPFIIVPLKEGEYHIYVKAAVRDSWLNDGSRKMLHVVPEGILVKFPKTLTIDPTKKGGEQQEIINSKIPLKDILPNTPTSTIISVTGEEQIAPTEHYVNANSLGTLMNQPSGNGETNMIQMALSVIATKYLDKTNQWETVGAEKRNEAVQHIRTGYERQLAYRKRDGSFAMFSYSPSSVWLTAYVVKVFTMASDLVTVRGSYICDAVKYLILNSQYPDGRFLETGTVSNREMTGDVHGTDSDASMTAFVLIALQESRTLCASAVNVLPGSINKAVSFLESRLPNLVNPIAVAMTSYALANENKLNRRILYLFASSDLSHWSVPKGQHFTLEATAYALLALVKTKAFEDAKPVVTWFKQQQKVGGGYGSTQATLMVYQAVGDYWDSVHTAEYDLLVSVFIPEQSKPHMFSFNKENYYGTRTLKFSGINKNVTVTATGFGKATLNMASLFYALPREKESDCQKFNLSVQFLPVKSSDESVYKLAIEFFYKDSVQDATMSVLDIGFLTGFTVNINDVQSVTRTQGYDISGSEMHSLLQGGPLIIYLNKVSRTPNVITFQMHQKLRVDHLQPAAISVYEFHNSEARCVKFYHPERSAGKLQTSCKNSVCRCAEERCCMQRKGTINNEERLQKARELLESHRTDFAFKIRVENTTSSLSIDSHTMRIEEVIKGGSYAQSFKGKLGTLLSYVRCREALDLRADKQYLIMGSSKEIHEDEQKQLFEYVLTENTWVEYWPTAGECRTLKHRRKCLGLEKFVSHYTVFGCRHEQESTLGQSTNPTSGEACGVQRKGSISTEERIAMAQKSTTTNQTDFVYKVKVDSSAHSSGADVYTAQIVTVCKEGSSDLGPLGEQRTFHSYPRCREGLDLKTGQTYLIMGSSTDIREDEQTQRFEYVLSERTWIEYWPTEAECQNSEHSATCLGFKQLYKIFECLS